MPFIEAHPMLHAAFEAWTEDHNYLGLDADHYDLACPPLLFVGGDAVPEGTSPLVLISIEPLKSNHFQAQAGYAGANVENYVDWNLNLYRRLPDLAPDPRPQAYFRNLDDFVAGWAGIEEIPNPAWDLFSGAMLELPYVPMHARRHDYGAIEAAHDVLAELLRQRLELVTTRWPEAMLVALGNFPDRLADGGLLGPAEPVDHVLAGATEAVHGVHYFDVPWERRSLTAAPARSLLIRRGPFSNWQNPRAAGRHALGSWVRQYFQDQ